MSFKGKKVVITGGTGALGTSVCAAFLDRGATVFSSYILDHEKSSFPASLMRSKRLHLTKADLSEEDQVQKWFGDIGSLDVLINAAGGFSMAPYTETELTTWRKMQDGNLTTTFLTCREGLKKMTAQQGGSIVNVAAFAASSPSSGMAAYTVSKNGVIYLTQTLAEETLSQKISVNAVLPSIMDTPANRDAMPDADFSIWVPIENVVHTILFLADPTSWHITGACIPLRGHI